PGNLAGLTEGPVRVRWRVTGLHHRCDAGVTVFECPDRVSEVFRVVINQRAANCQLPLNKFAGCDRNVGTALADEDELATRPDRIQCRPKGRMRAGGLKDERIPISPLLVALRTKPNSKLQPPPMRFHDE